MDVFSHGLWGQAILYKKYRTRPKVRWVGGLAFGMLPDVLVFAPGFVYFSLHGFRFQPEEFLSSHGVFGYALSAYNVTHSLVVFAFTFAVITLFRRGRPLWLLIPWGLHILMDIPTHPDFYSTPLFWPISDFKLVGFGVSWAHPAVLAANWAALAAVYFWIFLSDRNRKKSI